MTSKRQRQNYSGLVYIVELPVPHDTRSMLTVGSGLLRELPQRQHDVMMQVFSFFQRFTQIARDLLKRLENTRNSHIMTA